MQHPQNSCHIVSAGIDWLTVTGKSSESKENLYSAALALRSQAEGERQLIRKWSAKGYHGFQGDHFHWGERADSGTVRVSSAWAQSHWIALRAAAEHCTRVDLQVTVQFDSARPQMAEQLYRRLGTIPAGVGRPAGYSLIQSSNGGRTLNLGSRTSARLGRLYDKGVQAGTARPGFQWRYELELKDPLAQSCIASFQPDDSAILRCASLVHGFFLRRGVRPPWRPRVEASLSGERQESSVDARLEWLNRSVRPAVLQLVDAVGLESVLRALFGSERIAYFPTQPTSLQEGAPCQLQPASCFDAHSTPS